MLLKIRKWMFLLTNTLGNDLMEEKTCSVSPSAWAGVVVCQSSHKKTDAGWLSLRSESWKAKVKVAAHSAPNEDASWILKAISLCAHVAFPWCLSGDRKTNFSGAFIYDN